MVDKLGIAALACAGFALGGVARIGTSAGYSWLTPAMLVVGLGGAATVLGLLRVETGSFSWSHLRRLAEVWGRPARPRLMFLFGCLVALPVLSLHTSLISGADSARIVASILYVQRFGVEYLIQTQEVLLPHLVLGPLLALGGAALMKLFSVLSVIGLAGVVSYITWQMTRSAAAALAAVMALLSLGAIDERAYYLPMYAPMLAFGFLGCYLLHRAADQIQRRDQIRYAVLAAACLLLSIESHQVGQFFLIAVPILLIFHRSGGRVRSFLWTYAAFAFFYLPRALINLTEGGFSHFLTNRDDYWITHGYLIDIQKEFWHLKSWSPLGEYLSKSFGNIFSLVGWQGLFVLVLAVAAFLLTRRRVLWFGLTFAVLFAVLAVERRLPFYSRYYSQLLVGGAMTAGVAVGALLGRGRFYRAAGTSCVILLGALAAITLTTKVNAADRLERAVLQGPYPRLAAAVSDDRGVVGDRSTYLNFTRTDVLTYGGQFLTEDEFVTFLTWPSDQAVVDMMRRRGIGWVLLPENRKRWVFRYHKAWLLPHHGKRPVYPKAVRVSPLFCHVQTDHGASLYELSPTGAGEQADPHRQCPP